MYSSAVRKTPGIFSDLDDDGTMELIIAYSASGPSTTLYVWEIPRTGGGPASSQWPMFNNDSAHSGRQNGTRIEPPPDEISPVSAITSPKDGSTVTGKVTAVISAADNMSVTRVELYVDEILLSADTTEPYSIQWDTTAVSNGSHTLLAIAHDAAGNTGPSIPISVSVFNDTTAPDPPALISPTDGFVSESATPTFEWMSISDTSGVSYHLQLDNNPDFLSPEIDVDNLSNPSYTTVQELTDGTYNWRVLALDGAGNTSTWSEVRTITVSIQTCIPAVPMVNVLPASQSAQAGITLAYTVSVINTDTANCPASTFYLDRNLPIDWTGTLSTKSLILQPGETGKPALSVTSAANALPGSYGLSVLVSDIAGTTLNGSSEASYTVIEPQGDNESPADPTGLLADLKLKQVNLTWNSASDNVGVSGYQIWRNGNVIGETTATNFIDREISADETYTYQVVAYDAAGNTSGPSNSAIVEYGGKVNPGKGNQK